MRFIGDANKSPGDRVACQLTLIREKLIKAQRSFRRFEKCMSLRI